MRSRMDAFQDQQVPNSKVSKTNSRVQQRDWSSGGQASGLTRLSFLQKQREETGGCQRPADDRRRRRKRRVIDLALDSEGEEEFISRLLNI